MFNAAGRHRTRVQLLLNTERQKLQSIESIITDLRRCVSRHSNLIDFARVSLHSDMRHAYETFLRLFLSEVAGGIQDCGVEYQSEVHIQLGAFQSTIEHGGHCILASFNHSLEDLRRDDTPADSQ